MIGCHAAKDSACQRYEGKHSGIQRPVERIVQAIEYTHQQHYDEYMIHIQAIGVSAQLADQRRGTEILHIIHREKDKRAEHDARGGSEP